MRPIGSENRGQKESEPYRVLSLRVIMEAIDDKDTKYLRGETDDLRFWLHCAGIDFKLFHKKMWLRFPRKKRVEKTMVDRINDKRYMRATVRGMVEGC